MKPSHNLKSTVMAQIILLTIFALLFSLTVCGKRAEAQSDSDLVETVWVQETHIWTPDLSLIKVGTAAELHQYPSDYFESELECIVGARDHLTKYREDSAKVLHMKAYCTRILKSLTPLQVSPFRFRWDTLRFAIDNPYGEGIVT